MQKALSAYIPKLHTLNGTLKPWNSETYHTFGASRGAAARSVTVKLNDCGFDPQIRRWNIYLNLYFNFFAQVSILSAALNSATQHAMPPEFCRKWGTECLNTRLPLPTLLSAGYSVKLIFWFLIHSSLRKTTELTSYQLPTKNILFLPDCTQRKLMC